MRRVLPGMMLAGLFLLMLSALVVSPEMPEVSVPPPLPRDYHAVLAPMTPSGAQAELMTPERPAGLRLFAAVLLPSAVPGLLRPAAADSNGRVLCAARYENSFYPLFRAEVAGG